MIYGAEVVTCSAENLVKDATMMFAKAEETVGYQRAFRKPSPDNKDFVKKTLNDDGSVNYVMKVGNKEVTVVYKDGCPDFSDFKYKGTDGLAEVKVKYTGNRAKDIKLANEAAGFSKTPKGYTWHHLEDAETLILVESAVHNKFAHTGGYAIFKSIMKKLIGNAIDNPKVGIVPPQTGIVPPQTSIVPPQTGIVPPRTVIVPPKNYTTPPKIGIDPPKINLLC
jgi:hypothetical protein